jgi:hypothetical protein
MDAETAAEKGRQSHGHGDGTGHGPKVIHIQVQTPRGLWSMTTPEIAKLRPEYDVTTKIATVIADARSVFIFVEQDSKYTLFFSGVETDTDRTLASYHLEEGALFVLSVQGGNA